MTTNTEKLIDGNQSSMQSDTFVRLVASQNVDPPMVDIELQQKNGNHTNAQSEIKYDKPTRKMVYNKYFWRWVYYIISMMYFTILSIVEWKILDDNSKYNTNDSKFVWLQILLISFLNTPGLLTINISFSAFECNTNYVVGELERHRKSGTELPQNLVKKYKEIENEDMCCDNDCVRALMFSYSLIRFVLCTTILYTFGINYGTFQDTYDSPSLIEIFYVEVFNSIIFIAFCIIYIFREIYFSVKN
jgi:hypothetical protein